MRTSGSPPPRRRLPRPTWLAVAVLVVVLVPHGLAPAGAQDADGLGREVFDAHCAMCHGPDAEGMGTHPGLRGAVDRLGSEGVEVTIRQGRDVRPPMPAFADRLDREEIDAVVAYLATLEGDDRAGGPGGMMDDGMMGRWPWGRMGGLGGGAVLVAVGAVAGLLIALLAGVVGYLLGRGRAR
jgi:mono/diheme cytochrome c family protein